MRTSVLLALALAALIGGCQSISANKYYDADGFPKHEYYVAGGPAVEFETQQGGSTIIIADRVSRKVIITKVLGQNDSFDFNYNVSDKDWMTEKLTDMGIDQKNMKLAVYLIPNEKPAVDDAK